MSQMLIRLALLGAAGAAGTLARYGVQAMVVRIGWHAALATAAVNILGCLVFGLVVGSFEARSAVDANIRLVVLTGFLGAFTTFSALLGDASSLARAGDGGLAVGNVVTQVVAGGVLLSIGLVAGRALAA